MSKVVDLTSAVSFRMKALETLLRSYQFNFTSEEELQCAVEAILTQTKVPFEREYEFPPIVTDEPRHVTRVYSDAGVSDVLSKPRRTISKDRIDFIVGDIGLEIKIGFSYTDVVRQLHRYAAHDEIKALMLLTSRSQHTMPAEISGKTLCTVNIGLASSL